ncbi:MAG: RNA pseudouridine synthase, partial [Lachnospiraceae bacterium]|nr:RNA pseudouridine synthase [Lachnospiraceae bacterium]
RIGKYYLAVLHGRFSEPVRIRSLHEKNGQKNLVRISDLHVITERELRSSDLTKERKPIESMRMDISETGCVPLSYDEATDTTLVLAALHTGKAHQLRAQFAATGHPIVGDLKYGDKETAADRKCFGASGQLPHASLLIFPESGLSHTALSGKSFYSDPMGAGNAESETADGWHAFSAVYSVKEQRLVEAVLSHREVMMR